MTSSTAYVRMVKSVSNGDVEEFLPTNDAAYFFKAPVSLKHHERAAVLHFAKSLAAANARAPSSD
jgi:hypothetical protein